MRIENSSVSPYAERYSFDREYTPAAGWAQFDSDSDFSRKGAWVNPCELKAVFFTEGSLDEIFFDSEEEMATLILGWVEKGFNTHLDCGTIPASMELESKFREMGLGGVVAGAKDL